MQGTNERKMRDKMLEDEYNIFYDIQSIDDLVDYYKEYVRLYGTSSYINKMYNERLNELDIKNFLFGSN